MVLYFNIASLFRQSDETALPEQHLDNTKNTEKWSTKEDSKLVKAFKKYESNWHKIESEMALDKKSLEVCKDRVETLLQSNIKGTWTSDEDSTILKYLKKFGRNWSLIAKKLEGRNGKQVRERYINYLEKREALMSQKDEFT